MGRHSGKTKIKSKAGSEQMRDSFAPLRMAHILCAQALMPLLSMTQISPRVDKQRAVAILLKEGQEGEEEEPEDAHGVPIPGYAVDQNLAGFELAG